MADSFIVRVSPPLSWSDNEITRKVVCETIESEVIRHMKGAPDNFTNADMSIIFEKHSVTNTGGDVSTELLVAVSGKVNGREFMHRLDRKSSGMSGISADTMAFTSGGVVGLAGHKIAEKIMDATGVSDWEQRKLQEHQAARLRDDLLFDLLAKLDSFVGRQPSRYAATWWGLFAASVGLYLTGLIGSAVVLERGCKDGSIKAFGPTGLGLGAFVALPILFSAIAFGLIALPIQFFENETLGKKLVAFTGAKSSRSIKPISVFIGVGFLAITAGLLYLFTNG